MITDIIPPEIYNDDFYSALQSIINSDLDINTILEIGASSGEGSTQCFLKNKNKECKLFSIEVSKERFDVLNNNSYPNFYPYFGSSISLDQYMTDDEIKKFYNSTLTNINNYPLNIVLSWKQEEINYIQNNKAPLNILSKIKSDNNIEFFDLVLIDGSPFTGEAELKQCWGSKIIALDDTNDIKCYNAYLQLETSTEYELIYSNPNLRNGAAIFYLKD